MKTYKILTSQTVAGYTLTLEQKNYDRLAVQYGEQRKENLSYSVAAAEYGACLMHALACEGVLEVEAD